MRAAAIQFSPVFKDVASNLLVATNLIMQAAAEGAKLVVLPELCLTGYSFMSKTDVEPLAEELRSGKCFKTFRDLAQKLDVSIVWGFVRRDVGTKTLYNSQVLMLPDGRFIFYDKMNLWGQDFIWATEGKGSPPIITHLGKKIGLLICRDVRDKAHNVEDLYEKGDADVVCFGTNWGDGGFPAVSWVKFAKDNQTWVVVSNRYGQEANNNFGEGGSCIISPEGVVHCDGLLWNKPCIIYADIT